MGEQKQETETEKSEMTEMDAESQRQENKVSCMRGAFVTIKTVKTIN